ncbi:MAG: DUF4394 domain-containing protein [Flavipsychrobacter sp.]
MKNTILNIVAFTSLLHAQQASAQKIVGITQDDKIFTMASASAPGTATTPIAITGMTAGQTVAGIDYRPATGELYALGYNSSTTEAQLYTINATTGAATVINSTPIMLMLGSNSAISFDFNPTVDRIRVVGANKKNYRLHPVTGAIAATDMDLAYAVGDVNAAASAAIGACAYTNSYIGSTVTTLYNYDMSLNILTTQIPPNNGTLNTVGISGIVVNNVTKSIDMDIYMDPVTVTNMAYLAANTGANINDDLYTINLTTGMVTSVGMIGSGLDVKNIAVVIDRTMPAVTGKMVYALQGSSLISFDSDNPKFIRSSMAITGISAGQSIVGIDFRPKNGVLYALGYNMATMEYQLYTLSTNTAAATAVNATATAINLGSTGMVAFDFNPVADRIRVISRANGMNYRLNPDNGAIAVTDTTVAYIAGDVNVGKMPRIGAVAYTNSYMNAKTTELFGLDDSLGAYIKINAPNGGTLSTVMNGAYTVNLSDMTTDIDFFYDSTSVSNKGFVAANMMGAVNDKFYSISATGAMTLIADIGLGLPISDIAVEPQYKNSGTGIASVSAAQAFEMYPNPAQNEIYIKATGKDNTVQVYDVAGREVKRQTLTGNNLYIGDLNKGVYFIKLTSDGEVFKAQQLVKE